MSIDTIARVLYDAAGNALKVIQDGSDYLLGTKAILTDGAHDVGVSSTGRLQVESKPTPPWYGIVAAMLENGGSSEMAVNGSSTPVEFVWQPTTEDVDGVSLTLFGEDSTIYFGDKFFGISALQNGLLIEAKASDVEYEVGNFQRTRNIMQTALPGGFDLYSASPDALRGVFNLDGLTFRKSGTYTSPDFVKGTVRDNLTGLNHLSLFFRGSNIA